MFILVESWKVGKSEDRRPKTEDRSRVTEDACLGLSREAKYNDGGK